MLKFLTPGTSECVYIWRQGLIELIKVKSGDMDEA